MEGNLYPNIYIDEKTVKTAAKTTRSVCPECSRRLSYQKDDLNFEGSSKNENYRQNHNKDEQDYDAKNNRSYDNTNNNPLSGLFNNLGSMFGGGGGNNNFLSSLLPMLLKGGGGFDPTSILSAFGKGGNTSGGAGGENNIGGNNNTNGNNANILGGLLEGLSGMMNKNTKKTNPPPKPREFVDVNEIVLD